MARPNLTAAQRYYADFMMDVLVYTVVLNLVVEFVDSIVIDSFLVSLLTAVVMKVMIDLIDYLVKRVKAHFGDKGAGGKGRSLRSWDRKRRRFASGSSVPKLIVVAGPGQRLMSWLS
jgi:hypothetical protein